MTDACRPETAAMLVCVWGRISAVYLSISPPIGQSVSRTFGASPLREEASSPIPTARLSKSRREEESLFNQALEDGATPDNKGGRDHSSSCTLMTALSPR